MNSAELPMILFTVIAQMSVGAFWVLGGIHLYGYIRGIRPEAVDRVTNAAMYAVGPLLVLGFFAAFFHLHDPFHALNTFRHLGSSWLSREIASGVLFGATGFAFAFTQWFGIFSRKLREILAAITAVAGFLLVLSMVGVYYSVETIPAWHSPATWIFFFASAFLTGSLAVGVALLATWNLQMRRDRRTEKAEAARTGEATEKLNKKARKNIWTRLISDEPVTAELSLLTTKSLQGISLIAAIAGLVMLVTYPIYLVSLVDGGDTTSHVASQLIGPVLVIRLIVLAVVVVLTGIFAYIRAHGEETPSTPLVWIISSAFVLAVVTELLGRSLHYEGLYHVGLNTAQYLLGQ